MKTNKIRDLPDSELREMFAKHLGWTWDDKIITSPDGTSRARYWNKTTCRLRTMLPDIHNIEHSWKAVDSLFGTELLWVSIAKPTPDLDQYSASWAQEELDASDSGPQETAGRALAVAYCIIRSEVESRIDLDDII